MRSVLVSGAGIAGVTLAYWLARGGFRVTVVERATGLRSSGAPVDVDDDARFVVERMGLVPRLEAARTQVTEIVFVDGAGRGLARMPAPRTIELPRGDLASILYEASCNDAEYVFGDGIASLAQDAGGVDVWFGHGAPRRFDYVLGADGLHSAVRRLTFGPEQHFSRHMGLYVATLWLDEPAISLHQVLIHNAPGALLAVHPMTGRAGAAFIFRAAEAPDFDPHDVEQHRRLVRRAYVGGAWRTAELIERLNAASDFYFDPVTRVRLPQWCRGRVAVVGDAASCVSLLGGGSSLALSGAFTLAETLRAGRPLADYEREQRARLAPRQRGMTLASHLLVPSTRAGMAIRNFALSASMRRSFPRAATAVVG